MRIVTSIAEMQSIARTAHGAGKSLGLVPTMGFLHQGHASLMHEGRKRCDLLVTSIFVNPTQFGVGEDFERYPRDMERDSELARQAGVDLIFAPTATEMYPQGFETYVDVERLTLPLCGASRPGHFRGVTTVVCKLFNIVQPDLALFGKKDFQQLAVIRRMVADLNMAVEILGMPIIREPDGLAMSSRNSYLSPAERRSALCLNRAIGAARAAFRAGETSIARLRVRAEAIIAEEPAALIDYLEYRDGDTLAECSQADHRTLLALAVKIGQTRLIDNGIMGEDD